MYINCWTELYFLEGNFNHPPPSNDCINPAILIKPTTDVNAASPEGTQLRMSVKEAVTALVNAQLVEPEKRNE